MDLGPKSLKQWIYREWVGKLGFNESDRYLGRFGWQENVSKKVYAEENRPQQSPRRFVLIYFSQVRLHS